MNRLLQLGVLAIGIFCLALSTSKHWWILPIDCLPASAKSDAWQVSTIEPWVVPYFKFGSLGLLVVCLVLLLTQRWHRAGVVLTSFWAALLLSFPYWTIVAEPTLAAQANWLQAQHENLTWLGGDLSTGFEYQNHPNRARTSIVSTPRRLSVVPMPHWSLTDLNPGYFQELLEWLGYTNTFCEFVRRGWFLACLGTMAAWLYACVGRGKVRSRYVSLGLRVFGGTVAVGSICIWISPLACSRHLNSAAHHTARGQYYAALDQLQQSARLVPALAEDTYYVAQLGLLQHLTGNHSAPAARLYQAHLLERAGRLEQASAGYRVLTKTLPALTAVRREACRALLRSAISAYNSAAYEKASERFRAVLAVEPCNVKAIYSLSLIALRHHNRWELENFTRHQYAIYACFQFANKKVILADAQRQRLMLALDQHDVTAAVDILPKLRRP